MPASDQPEQQHPLYATDRDLVDALLATERPADAQLVDLGRLFMRYAGFPGALDLQADLDKTLRLSIERYAARAQRPAEPLLERVVSEGLATRAELDNA